MALLSSSTTEEKRQMVGTTRVDGYNNLQGEINSAALYRELVETEDRSRLSRLYERLAAVQECTLITLLTRRSVFLSGIRRVSIGLAAAALTYRDGLLIRTIVGQ
jgi:predicted RNA polymerase sigma factor